MRQTDNTAKAAPPRGRIRAAVVVLGIMPSWVLLAAGVISIGFLPLVQLASSEVRQRFLLWTALALGSAVVHLFALRRRKSALQSFLKWLAVAADCGLLLFALAEFRDEFELFGRLSFPLLAWFPTLIAIPSLVALALSHVSRQTPPRFTLRELAVVIVALAVFLVLAREILQPEQFGRFQSQEAATLEVKALGGGVYRENWTVLGVNLRGTRAQDDDLKLLAEFPDVRSVSLENSRVTDAGLAHLAGRTEIRSLYLDNLAVTDAGLAHFRGLTGMSYLTLSGTKITDAGLANLSGMLQLSQLYLGGTQITDAGLEHLRGLKQLDYLNLVGTQVTREGIDQLHAELPGTRIDGKLKGEYYSVGP